MKTLVRNIILLAVMVAAFGTSNAVAQTLRDASYNYVGKIAPNGTVRNSEYGSVGFFNADGTIANAKGKTVGRICDGDSKPLGKIEIKTGKVTDEEGKVLGYANGISIQRVAAYYFFDFFK